MLVAYALDENDRLFAVNEEWSRFAVANDAPELYPQNILGHSIWEYIVDEATRELYRQVLKLVRSGEAVELVLRCDAPGERRLLEMTVRRGTDSDVEFTTRVLCAKPRPEQRLLKRSTPKNRARLRMCCWCNQVDVGQWMELEEAAPKLGLENAAALPLIEYVTCPRCHAKISGILEAARTTHTGRTF